MTNSVIEFNDGSGGTVTLCGIPVPIDSDAGGTFITDCVRFVEYLLTAEQLKKKYQLSDDACRERFIATQRSKRPSPRREAGRSSGAVADQVRDGREPQDRHGARACDTSIDTAARG
jgi:hypothetical protein